MSTMWEAQQPRISRLLQDIQQGELALPLFQRPAVWTAKSNEIPFLIAILLGRPTGSLLTLDYTSPDGKIFPVQSIENAPNTDRKNAKRLILDGQQRLTTLFRALDCGWIEETEEKHEDGTVVQRTVVARMIVDVRAATLRGELIEDDFKLKKGADADVGVMARNGEIDFRTLGNKEELKRWTRIFDETWGGETDESIALWSSQLGRVIPFFEDVLDYRFPEMEVVSGTEVGVVAEIFEHMNSRGQALNRFDLMVARTYVAKPGVHPQEFYDLRDDWETLLSSSDSLQRLGIDSGDGLIPLQLIAWQADTKVSTSAVLEMDGKTVIGHDPKHPGLGLKAAVEALDQAAQFLIESCGIAAPKLLPQKGMLIPLANLYLREHRNSAASSLEKHNLQKWFFACCFALPAPRYYGGVNSRVAEDCALLEQWADTGTAPDFVSDLTREHIDKLELSQPMTRERNHHGLGALALLVNAGSKDWSEDRPFVKDAPAIHLHHMVPEERLKTWWKGPGENRQKRMNIANFAPISAKKNQKHGDTLPGQVLDSLGKHADPIVESHAADPSLLRKAFENKTAFNTFCSDRADRLKALIKSELGL